jgi:hypothetical protein
MKIAPPGMGGQGIHGHGVCKSKSKELLLLNLEALKALKKHYAGVKELKRNPLCVALQLPVEHPHLYESDCSKCCWVWFTGGMCNIDKIGIHGNVPAPSSTTELFHLHYLWPDAVFLSLD